MFKITVQGGFARGSPKLMDALQEREPRRKRRRPMRKVEARDGVQVQRENAGQQPEVAAPAWHEWLLYGVYPVILVVTLAVLTIRPMMEPDTWFHMALGREVVENQTLPKVDIFSWQAQGNEWISSGWVSSVLLYLAYAKGGALGLTGLVFVVTAGTYLTLYFRSLTAGLGRGSMVGLLLLVAATAYLRFTPRPEIFSQAFLVGTLLLLSAAGSAYAQGAGARWKLLWLLPPLVALWANFHAGFFVILPGLVLFGLHQHITAKAKGSLLHLWGPIGLACLAGLANPYGWRILTLPWKIKRMPGVAENVYEWVPIFSQAHAALPAVANVGYVLLALFVLVALAAVHRRMPWWQVGLLLVLLALPLYERRHIALAALAGPAILYPYLGWLDRAVGRRAFVLAVIAAAGAAVLCALQWSGKLEVGKGLLKAELDRDLLPVGAASFMKENPPPGPLFNNYGPGGYLLYHLSPETKVFIDGRLDTYNASTWLDYLAAENGSLAVEELTKKYNLNSMLVYTRGMGTGRDHLVTRVNNTPGWRLVYFDDSYALFVRDTDTSQAYLKRHAYNFVTPFNLGRLQEMKRLALSGQMETELARAVKESGGSAKAHLAAAIYARDQGREAVYQEHVEAARRRNPNIGLAQ